LLSNDDDESGGDDDDDEQTNNKADELRIPLTSIIECSVECYYRFERCVVIASVDVCRMNPFHIHHRPYGSTLDPRPAPGGGWLY
jgi:hypothetical protein